MRIRSLWLPAAALFASSVVQPSPAQATRQVTDAAGRVVTLPSTVNRIADPWHANNAMVLML
jgi:ABC-type Fe3+-hydroxamate transport system substrate-binding protein